MATTMSEVVRAHVNGNGKGMIVELVGTAGVGKSTLYRALLKEKTPWLVGDDVPPVWKISTAYFYISNILKLGPTLVRTTTNGGRLLQRRELAFLAILNGWHEILKKKVEQKNNIILLDQGPISKIAYMMVWAPDSLFKSNIQGWWDKVYENWKRTIDMVILMDAADETVIHRVNTRPQDHHLKGEPKNVFEFWLNRYRDIYGYIINKLVSNNEHKIRVIKINSGIYAVDELVQKVMHIFTTEDEDII